MPVGVHESEHGYTFSSRTELVAGVHPRFAGAKLISYVARSRRQVFKSQISRRDIFYPKECLNGSAAGSKLTINPNPLAKRLMCPSRAFERHLLDLRGTP